MGKNSVKRVIVVGATSGLGRGIAETYIDRGCQVGILGRRGNLLEEVAAGRENVKTAICDVMCPTETIETLQGMVETLGGLDLLVLSSGVGNQNWDLDYALDRRMIDTNVQGWTAIVDWAYRLFEKQGHGHLTAISSIAGLRGLAPAPCYSGSKAYQIHYLEALRERAIASPYPIYITDIRPGFVDTAILANPKQFFWVLPVDKAVRAIVRAIDCKKGVATITTRWALLAPVMKILPTRIFAWAVGNRGGLKTKD